jgi:glycosyltransferase involved in cell wall biosynthesis
MASGAGRSMRRDPQQAASAAGDRPIRIGINILYLRPGIVGGTETYARELLAAMARLERPFECVLFVNPRAADSFETFQADPRFEVVRCPVPGPAFLRHIWEQANFPRLCRKYRLDLLHSLGHVSPLLPRCAKAVTVHDLIYKVSPESISLARKWFWSVMIPLSAKVCDAVIVGSDTVRQDVMNILKLEPHRACLTPFGPGQSWPEAAPWESTQLKYSVPEKYFLAVGAMEHKRLDLVREAARRLHERRGVRVPVLVAGNGSEQHRNGDDLLQPLGFVPAEELCTLYSKAIALVCSSELEGFGLPVLEAMGAGTPVIAVQRGALNEVVGGAGVMVEHGDSGALAEAMWSMIGRDDFREHLRQRGRERAEAFSWDDCAKATFQVYETVLRRREE